MRLTFAEFLRQFSHQTLIFTTDIPSTPETSGPNSWSDRHLIPSHLIQSHLIPSHPIPSHLICSHLASGRSSALHERGGITSDLSAPPVHLPKTFGAPPAHLQDISSTPPAHLQHTSSASPGNALTSAHCQFTRTSRAPPPISRPGWYRTPPLPTSHFPVPSSHFQFPLPVPTSSSHFPAPTPQFRPSLCNGPEPVWGVTGAIEGG